VHDAKLLVRALWSGGGPAHSVSAYQRANVRNAPSTGSDIVSYVGEGECYPPNCWTHGERITDNRVTNDVWVQLPLRAGGVGYVRAIYLKGDEPGDLPANKHC
jgi:hypothetical protein